MPNSIELICSQGKDYAKLLEDAAKQVDSDFDAGLLRGLADVMRELPAALDGDRAEIERLRAFISRLDALNDNPACFNSNIDAAIREFRALEEEGMSDWIRLPSKDRRIAQGDDWAGDAWQHVLTLEVHWTAVNKGPPLTTRFYEGEEKA